jgi:hypothetical protein
LSISISFDIWIDLHIIVSDIEVLSEVSKTFVSKRRNSSSSNLKPQKNTKSKKDFKRGIKLSFSKKRNSSSKKKEKISKSPSYVPTTPDFFFISLFFPTFGN